MLSTSIKDDKIDQYDAFIMVIGTQKHKLKVRRH